MRDNHLTFNANPFCERKCLIWDKLASGNSLNQQKLLIHSQHFVSATSCSRLHNRTSRRFRANSQHLAFVIPPETNSLIQEKFFIIRYAKLLCRIGTQVRVSSDAFHQLLLSTTATYIIWDETPTGVFFPTRWDVKGLLTSIYTHIEDSQLQGKYSKLTNNGRVRWQNIVLKEPRSRHVPRKFPTRSFYKKTIRKIGFFTPDWLITNYFSDLCDVAALLQRLNTFNNTFLEFRFV